LVKLTTDPKVGTFTQVLDQDGSSSAWRKIGSASSRSSR